MRDGSLRVCAYSADENRSDSTGVVVALDGFNERVCRCLPAVCAVVMVYPDVCIVGLVRLIFQCRTVYFVYGLHFFYSGMLFPYAVPVNKRFFAGIPDA